MTTHLIRDSLVVTLNLLTLESSWLTCHLLAIELQDWSNSYYSLLLHVLLWEVTSYSCRNLTSMSLQRIRSYCEIIS